MARIGENGFGPVHRRIVEVLREHRRPLALDKLVARIGISRNAFRSIYEPVLPGRLPRRAAVTETR